MRIWVLSGLLAAASASAQDTVYLMAGEESFAQFGHAVASLGDTNADGFADFAVGDPRADANGPWSGRVIVYSGRDGSILFQVDGTRPGARFGERIALAGDTNGDAVPDIVVAAPWDDTIALQNGMVAILSGVDGSTLQTIHAPDPVAMFGHEIAGGVDCDGDGCADIAVGEPLADYAGDDSGSVFAYSGRTGALLGRFDGDAPRDMFGWSVELFDDMDGDNRGEIGGGCVQQFASTLGYVHVWSVSAGTLLHTWSGDQSNDKCGYSIARAGDVDNDGFGDVLGGFYGHSTPGLIWRGAVRVWSGATGAELYTLFGDSAFRRFGFTLSCAGDIDGDQHDDFVVGTESDFRVRAFSGQTGALLLEVSRPGVRNFGSALSAGHDINGDGIPDFVGATRDANIAGTITGAVEVVSLREMSLSASVHEISLSDGGTQWLTLDAGPAFGGRTYLLFGSLSGIVPGLPLDVGVHLPLNFDGYSSATAANPNLPPMVNSAGVLDGATGVGLAGFQLPAGTDPGLAGFVLDHAFLLIPVPGQWFDFASNSVPVRLVP